MSRARDDLAIVFGARVQAARGRAGLSRQALADKVGVSLSCVIVWDRGEGTPWVRQLVALAVALGVTTDYLLALDARTEAA